MTDERTGDGGAANTPPFPRSREDEPLPPPFAAPGTEPAGAAAGSRAHDPRATHAAGEPDHASAAGEPRARRTPRGGAAGRAGASILHRAERTLHHGLGHLADQFEDAAERIDHLADGRLAALGPRGERAAGAAGSAAGWLHGAADYLRASDLGVIQRDVERQVREKPLQTLLVSAGAGWLLGKIIR